MEKEIKASVYEPINIKQLACRVSPKLGKSIPKFMYRHFEKLLHVDEINEFLSKHNDDDTQTFLDEALKFIGVDVSYEGRGLEAIEELRGRNVMFASNHPYGGPEAVILLQQIHTMFPDVKLVAQSFLKFIKPLGVACVFNKKDVRTLKEAVDNHLPLLIYPAGYCSRKLKNHEIFDYEWKNSFVKIAKKNDMPIAIFYTDGALSKRIHRWTRFRKIFRISTSIESMYLVDEMFRLRGQKLRIVVGSTIDPKKLDNSVDNTEWADRIRQYCFDLRKNPDLEFDYSKPAVLTKK